MGFLEGGRAEASGRGCFDRRRLCVHHRPSPSHARPEPSILSRRLEFAYSAGLSRRIACSRLVCWPLRVVSSALSLCVASPRPLPLHCKRSWQFAWERMDLACMVRDLAGLCSKLSGISRGMVRLRNARYRRA